MYQLIDGKKASEHFKQEIANEVQQMVSNGQRAPHLAAILVGNDGASETYVAHKIKACKQVGFDSSLVRLPNTVTENELLHHIQQLNQDHQIDGFIVQLPLPNHVAEQKVIEMVNPQKDVDGFHAINVGRMVAGLPCYIPATPQGIISLLDHYSIETAGKHCVVVGRSNIVGTPISILLSRKSKTGNATVTLCHSRTPNIGHFTKEADIIVVAIGQPNFLTAEMVKDGAVVIDVGTTRVQSKKTKSGWRLKGDVNFKEVAPKCSYITPVPGGVGPMTIVSLLQNTLKATRSS